MQRGPNLVSYRDLITSRQAEAEGIADWLTKVKTGPRAGRVRVCGYCGGRVDWPRQSWCSALCAGSWLVQHDWQGMRRHLWVRAAGRCLECARPTGIYRGPFSVYLTNGRGLIHRTGWPVAEIDHIVELTDGGTNEISNLRVLCPDCHKAKTAAAARARALARQEARERATGQRRLF